MLLANTGLLQQYHKSFSRPDYYFCYLLRCQILFSLKSDQWFKVGLFPHCYDCRHGFWAEIDISAV